MGLCASAEAERQKFGANEIKAAPETNTRPANGRSVERLFRQLDRGNTGKLTKEDVLLLLRAASRSKASSDEKERERAEDIMKKADKDRDGMLNLEEFSWWIETDSFAVNSADLSSINKTVLELKRSEAASSKKLEAIWAKYRDKNNAEEEEEEEEDIDEEDEVLEDNLGEFLKDIHLDPDGVESFAFAYSIKHEHAGPISRQHFISGLREQDVDSWESLLTWAKRLRIQLKEPKMYRALYIWMFDYIKEANRKTIAKEYAEHLWSVMLPAVFPLYPKWTEFLDTKYESTVVKRDLWNCLYDFAIEIKDDLTNYDRHSGAWPVVIDEFYDFCAHSDANNNNQQTQEHQQQ